MTRVLVVEDDQAIREGLRDALEYAGYEVFLAEDGQRALETALAADLDLILLDLILPQRDGLSILAEVRRLKPTLPVILVTARGAEDDRVEGLKGGADDYVVKPFSARELLARVEAVLRRSPSRVEPLSEITIAGRRVRFDLMRVERNGESVQLSERESQILKLLAESAGRPVSRAELLERVWGLNPQGLTTRTVDMHIARLREKLADDGSPPVIQTVRSRGYLVELECREESA